MISIYKSMGGNQLMRISPKQEGFTDDPDIGSLSKIKTLLYRHLEHKSNPQLIGRLYLNQSEVYQKIRNYPLAYDALEKAMEYFADLEDILNLALAYYYQGLLLTEEKKYLQARENLYQGFSLLSDDRNEEILLKCQITYQLGRVLEEIGLLEEAVANLEDGALLAEIHGFNYQEAQMMHLLGQISLKLGNLDQAKQILLKILPKWQMLNDQYQIGLVLDDLGYVYLQLKENKRAVSAFKYSIKMLEKFNSSKLPTSLLKLAQIYLEIDSDQSKLYCQKAIDAVLTHLADKFTEDMEKQLAEVFYIMALFCQQRNYLKNMELFFKKSLKIYQKYHLQENWSQVYQTYRKYLPTGEELSFNATTELVKGLTGHGQFNLKKIVGQIS